MSPRTLSRSRRRRPRRYPAAGFVASLFTPLAYSPYAWYDFSDTSTITDAGGGAVSQVLDKSGNGRTLTQATAARRPTTGTRTLNGRNVLDFDSAATTPDLLASGNFTQATPWTCFAVFQSDVAVLPGTEYNNVFSLGAGGPEFYISGPTDNFAVYAGIGVPSLGAANTNAHMYSGTFGATDAHFIDGVSVSTADTGAGGLSADAICIGSYTPTDVEGWDGIIAEVIFCAATLAAADRSKLESYLRAKWGTP